MIISIIGPSGCGKGSQAKPLAEKFKIPHFSMGKILREAYRKRTPEGLEAERFWGRGLWVPLDLVNKIFLPFLKGKVAQRGFVIEGYPREIRQAKWLDSYLKSVQRKVDLVIFLDTPEDLCLERIQGRILEDAESNAVRKDETEEIIKQRLASYRKTVDPILDYYRKRGVLEEIDNRPSINEVFQAVLGALKDRVEVGKD